MLIGISPPHGLTRVGLRRAMALVEDLARALARGRADFAG